MRFKEIVQQGSIFHRYVVFFIFFVIFFLCFFFLFQKLEKKYLVVLVGKKEKRRFGSNKKKTLKRENLNIKKKSLGFFSGKNIQFIWIPFFFYQRILFS